MWPTTFALEFSVHPRTIKVSLLPLYYWHFSHEKNTRLSTPAQLQCSRSEVGEPGNKTVCNACVHMQCGTCNVCVCVCNLCACMCAMCVCACVCACVCVCACNVYVQHVIHVCVHTRATCVSCSHVTSFSSDIWTRIINQYLKIPDSGMDSLSMLSDLLG